MPAKKQPASVQDIRLKIVYRKPDTLVEYLQNAKQHKPKQVENVRASLDKFGFNNPILLDGKNGMVAGHCRLRAATMAPAWKMVPTVDLSHLSATEKRAYILADNRLAETNTSWDLEMLSSELQFLKAEDFDIDMTGFDSSFLIEDEGDEKKDNATPDPPAIATTVLGDVWLLGEHRLMCGDSTSLESVEILMNGARADICFTSPPYNVDVAIMGNPEKYLNKGSDNRTSEDYADFLNSFVRAALSVTDFVFENVQSLKGNKLALLAHLHELRDKYADTMIWDKLTAEPAMARKVLNSQFEYVHIFSHAANRVIGVRDFRGTVSNVVQIASRQDKDFADVHKATYPVALVLHFLKTFVKSSVLDSFAGTGTVFIAAEKLNRISYGMELDPLYCDVSIMRWQDYTGKQATLEATGKTFAQTRTARLTPTKKRQAKSGTSQKTF